MGSNQLIRNIEPLIAKQIKNKLKLKVIFIAKTKEDAKFYKKYFFNYFDEVLYNKYRIDKTYIRDHKKFKNPEKKALEIEKKYKMSIARIFFNNRVIGRGFFGSGGVRHPKNRTHQETTYKEQLNMAINNILFWENLFDKENVEIAINLEEAPHQLAIKNKIKAYRLYEGKFKNTFSWIEHDKLDPIVTKKDLKINYKSSLKKIEIDAPYQSYLNVRLMDLDKLKLFKNLKMVMYKALQILYGKLKGYEKSKNTYFLDETLSIWRIRSSYKAYLKKVSVDLEKLKNKKFIYFPLLTEPETSLHNVADDFFFQLSAINLISRDLPSDYLLVVKEHIIAYGRRPKDFYDQLNDLGNVVLASPTELGLNYIKKCKAVACITGTAGWEAIAMGIPVISFSRHNTWNFLDHVYYVNNFQDLRNIFLSIEKNNYPNKNSKKQGANFYIAYLNKLIKVKFYNYLIPLSKKIEEIPDHMKEVASILSIGLLKKIKKTK